MNEKLIMQVQDKMGSKSTEELLNIFEENNREEWSIEAFEAIQRILIARNVKPPVQLKHVRHQKKDTFVTQNDMETGRDTHVLGNILFVGLLLLFVGLLVSAVCFYATSKKHFFFQALQVIPALFAVAFAISSISSFEAVTRTKSRNRQAIARISSNIMLCGLFALLSAASLMGFIPPRHLPWILPVVVIALPIIVMMGETLLMEKETLVAFLFMLGAVVAGALTWGQLALVEHLDTWLVLIIGFIPVPLLGITVLITGVASVFFLVVALSGAVFHTVRVACRVS